jgi:bisphosphoglycerate-independent phosphoglycerate mutase (AlkP superfamily)
MKELKPKLMLVNYQDPDYVHWGNISHYTRAIAIIDDGIRQIVEAASADPNYRGNTVFIVTPDCGRDDNPLMKIPYQHHFNSRAAHEVWAFAYGRGIGRGVVDKVVEQTAIARTVGQIMGFEARSAETPALSEVFA